MRFAAILLMSVALGGCGSGGSEQNAAADKVAKKAPVKAAPQVPELKDGNVTPNEDRIATIGVLNKRNNLSEDLIMKVGDSRRAGNVMVKLESCERTAPWEAPQETGAFVQVSVFERPAPRRDEQWRRIFSGWLFKNSPALNVVEHPVYDVWVKDCAMKYPGESAKPAPAASSSSAPKASGSESGAEPAE